MVKFNAMPKGGQLRGSKAFINKDILAKSDVNRLFGKKKGVFVLFPSLNLVMVAGDMVNGGFDHVRPFTH